MKKTILYKTLFFCWAILALTGCDLDLQKNYDYEPSVDDPYVKVTAWEYFQDHKDMFSEMIAAIEYTGLKDYYTDVCVDYVERRKWTDDYVCMEESMAGCSR